MRVLDQEYWNDRSVLLNESLLDIGDEYYNRLAKEYDRSISRIEKEIESFYNRFSDENKIPFAEAKKILTSSERDRFAMDLDEYIEKGRTLNYSQQWTAQLENASTVHRVTRLQYLRTQMHQQVEELHAKYGTGLTDTLTQVYTEGYYRNIFDTQKAYGKGKAFATLDTEKVKQIIGRPWAPDGSNFSEKIWADREGLVNFLNKELTQSFIRGENADRLIKALKKKFGVSSRNAAQLVQTETAFFSAAAKLESYKALGYKKYTIVAVMDAKTSPFCREMDAEVFDLKDFQPGTTANPFHPRCRTTTAPYMDKGANKAGPGMLLDHASGEMYTIPEDMTYSEWHDKYVDGDSPSFANIELGPGNTEGHDSDPDGKPVFVERLTPEMIDSKLQEYENEIKDNDNETAYVITDEGEVYRATGDRDFVSLEGIPPEKLNRAIITHNHTLNEWGESDSFSHYDYALVQEYPGIKELRAVTPHYRFRMKLLKALDIPYKDLYIPGLQKARDAGEEGQNQHYIMEYLKELGYIEYTRERIDS